MDYPFVCFSPEALGETNGDAPFHGEIEAFAKSIDEESLNAFYEGRLRWHWYPILSSGFNSFSVHQDLTPCLKGEKLRDAIGWAAKIASREEGQRFIAALGLLAFLCMEEKESLEVPLLTKHFMAIRERVTRNAIDPNIHYWFSWIALQQLNTGKMPEGYTGDFDRAGLNAPKDE
jgi:hypothetical protein